MNGAVDHNGLFTDLIILGGLFLVLLAVVGPCLTQPRRRMKRAHQAFLQSTQGVLLTTTEPPPASKAAKPPKLVSGQAVVTANFIIHQLALLRFLFGGEQGWLRYLSAWALYLALSRMIRQAKAEGYNAIANVRIETSDIGSLVGRGPKLITEVFVYGTAYVAERA